MQNPCTGFYGLFKARKLSVNFTRAIKSDIQSYYKALYEKYLIQKSEKLQF